MSDAGGPYTSQTYPAAATVAGAVPGLDATPAASLEGIAPSLSYYNGTFTHVSQLAGLTSSSFAPSAIGNYTVVAFFAGSTDYTSGSALADFSISQIAPTLKVSDAGGPFTGNPYNADVTVAGAIPGVDTTPAASLEGVKPTLSYFSGTFTSVSQLAGLTPLSGAPSTIGNYTVEASFAGSTDYYSAPR